MILPKPTANTEAGLPSALCLVNQTLFSFIWIGKSPYKKKKMGLVHETKCNLLLTLKRRGLPSATYC